MTVEQIKANLQYFLPKHILTRFVGFFASRKLGRVTQFFINRFINSYQINTEEMQGKPADYKTFNEFFSRPLKKGARPIDKTVDSVIFPADGKISQFGELLENFQLQAKDHYFTTDALLGDKKDAEAFKNGSFMTVYLSPQDYHRVHIPYAGKLLKMTHIPGELFSVNPLYTRQIPELFSRNERVVCLFETALGKMAVVFVGAAIVRSIYTVWAGTVAPHKSGKISVKKYNSDDLTFEKGEEIGKFLMGSTVICLFEKNKISFEKLEPEQKVKVGEKMAQGHSGKELNQKAKKNKK